MGRGKIEIKRIENSTNRQVTFSKRRNGIIKKAREISILCEAQVSVVIFSSSGKMSEYRSPSTSLSEILERYQQNSGEKLWDAKHESLSAEIDRIKKENDNMQIELRHLKGEDLNSLYPKELIPIEEALQIGLTSVREKQMEIWKMHKNNEKLLEDENKQLTYMLHHQQLAMDGGVRELELGYHQKDREFAPQMTMAFRVQPIQPNLQENK
uniref:GLO-like MADS-BOX transcription factor n=1 Tax=Canna indica TaxID=4628 RepID=H9C1F1_9LILI|nr:GLO-like MADS-BOX transcription factor [Canna indica]AFD36430.1 PI-like MADS box transcription factor [Canna indica]